MSDTKLALDELRKGLRIFRAFEHAEGVITVVQAAEQRVAEANAQIATLTTTVDQLQAAALQAKAAGEQHLADARATAEKALAECQTECQEKRAEATTLANDIVAEANAVMAKAHAELDALHAEFNETTGRHEALAADVKDLEARAEKARAYIAKLKE